MDEDKKLPKIINIPTEQSQGEFLIYTSPDGNQKIQVRLIDETVWLSQKLMSELFQKDIRTINEHINNIFEEYELEKNFSTVRNFRIVQKEGTREVSREIAFYSLDVIISVGYRVKSLRGTQFRQWATQRIKEYLIKGFSINVEYLKDPSGADYFEELLEKIREIRTSEKRFYQKIRDLFALSSDYDKNDKKIQEFFAEVQNKLLFAVTQMTAPEIIKSRANENDINFGLTNYSGEKPLKKDIYISKNYLQENELKELELLVTQFLDYAELKTQKRQEIKMSDWREFVDKFIIFNEYDLLKTKGFVSRKELEKFLEPKYKEFNEARKKREALEADAEDLKELEAIEHKMIAEKSRKDK